MGLAETNRPPFDLPEAEGELVAGYFTEYGGAYFAMFFIGEYAQILLLSGVCVIMYVGGQIIGSGSSISNGMVFLCSPLPLLSYLLIVFGFI